MINKIELAKRVYNIMEMLEPTMLCNTECIEPNDIYADICKYPEYVINGLCDLIDDITKARE